jgi:hypothetical protein
MATNPNQDSPYTSRNLRVNRRRLRRGTSGGDSNSTTLPFLYQAIGRPLATARGADAQRAERTRHASLILAYVFPFVGVILGYIALRHAF